MPVLWCRSEPPSRRQAVTCGNNDCAMPSDGKSPLAGSFRLSISLPSGELFGESEYGINVTACPPEWFFHVPSGSCKTCDTSKSVRNGEKVAYSQKKGYWADLDNAELGFVSVTMLSGDFASVAAFTDLAETKMQGLYSESTYNWNCR